MLDHVSVRVTDYDRSKRFYEAALAPLGYVLAMETDSGAGFRKGRRRWPTTVELTAPRATVSGR